MHYQTLAELYEVISQTTKRLEKTLALSKFMKTHLSSATDEEKEMFFMMLRGNIFPEWDERKISFAAKYALKSLSLSSGKSLAHLETLWKKKGDLGLVAEEAMKTKTQATLFSEPLTIKKAYTNLTKLSTQGGQGSADIKVKMVAELLGLASPIEAKYITRTVLEDLRVGFGESTVRDAIAWACFDSIEETEKGIEVKDRESYNELTAVLQEAFDMTNEWSKVFTLAQQGKEHLAEVTLKLFVPVKCMLYPKANDIADAFERLGKPSAFEYKYDGFRMQIHKQKDSVELYTRRLERVTNQFPDVVEAIQKHILADEVILDCEVLGYDTETKKHVPFQFISQRIKRKHGIAQMAKDLPVQIVVFDLLFEKGKSMIKETYETRRKHIEALIPQDAFDIIPTKRILTSDEIEAQEFFTQAIQQGYEGAMAKKLDAIYKPGARVGYGMKLKEIKETLDLVVVGAEYGEGKRTGVLSSFTVACRSEDGEFLEIGKVSTGLKEKSEEGTSFEQVTEILKPHIKSENAKQVVVSPVIIFEVGYEEIQKSTSYASGYALRFPRFLMLREDKGIDEASSIDYVDSLFEEYAK